MSEHNEAPDSAENPASDDAKQDLIPRSEAQKAFQARDELKKENRELAKRLEELEGKQAQQSGDLEKILGLKDKKIQDLEAMLADATGQIEAKDRAVRERDFAASVLDGVPASHQSIAREVLEARILKGQYDLSGDSDIKSAAKKAQKELAASHPQLFEEAPVPSTRTPGVSLDHSKARSLDDIPASEWASYAKEDPEKMRALIRQYTGG